MALGQKKTQNRTTIKDLEKRINELEERLILVESRKSYKGKSLNKVEIYNNEKEPEQIENMKMNYSSKIDSMRNAIKILPPNLKVNDRHLSKNIGAICGFKVTEEMIDEAYSE